MNAAHVVESKLLAYFCCSVVYFWAIVSVWCVVSVCGECVWYVCVCVYALSSVRLVWLLCAPIVKLNCNRHVFAPSVCV